MNEDEWLTGTDFTAHARFADKHLSPRRQRLLAAGFCRAVSDLFDHPDLTDALDVIDQFADDLVPVAALARARQECRAIVQQAHQSYISRTDDGTDNDDALKGWIRHELAWAVANSASTPLKVADVGSRATQAAVQASTGIIQVMPVTSDELDAATAAQHLAMRAVVWEIVGNPFRPVYFSPEWRTDTAVSLARQMYDAREFSAMPILADALQDAGCDHEELLAHCRREGTHLRGCWVLDLVLGK